MTVDYAIEQGRNVKAGEIYGYFVQTFVMSAIGSYFDQFEKTGLRELGRAVAHGTFNGAMRYAQGGKFEHGFMSGGACAERLIFIFLFSYVKQQICNKRL